MISTNAEMLAHFKQTGDTCAPESLMSKQAKSLNSSRFIRYSVNQNTYYTTRYVYEVEKEIAKKAIEHRDSPSTYPKPNWKEIEEMIRQYENIEGNKLGIDFHLAKEQSEAVHKAISNTLFVLTGGPGTGKTCVLKCIQYILKQIKPGGSIKFTAPTGKAARRITESVGEEASTVQKAMHLTCETARPTAIRCDCIIVDEISMLDTLTADAFFCAVRKGTKIILVGDVDQLPSVGFGSVLRDLIESSVIECEALKAPQRQKEGSTLYENIVRLRNGQYQLQAGDDFKIINAVKGQEQKQLLDEYYKAVDKWGIDDVCCLTPYRRVGNTCANILNDIIQRTLNPGDENNSIKTVIYEDMDEESAKGTRRNIKFVVGDPVIQLVNRAEVANGDVGKIVSVDVRLREVSVRYEGNIVVTYKEKQLSQLNLAYCISVHKSQGSEYKCVITAAFKEHEKMMSRNMIYTAVTRAKKECIFIMEENVVKAGLKVQAGYIRNTLLSALINHEGRRSALLRAIEVA